MTNLATVDIEADRTLPAAPVVSDAASIMAVISRAASDPSTDVDKLERLMAMYERITASRAKTAYDSALSEMQPNLPVVDRRGKITIKEKGGEKVIQSTPYALFEDINEAVRPILAEHGFAVSFRTGLATDGKITVTGILSHRDGHREETTMTLPHDSTGSKNSVQAVGSSTSYGKRYVLTALLNITTRGEDDDGKTGGDGDTITADQAATLRALAEEVGADLIKFCQHFKIASIPAMPAEQYRSALAGLEKKRRKA